MASNLQKFSSQMDRRVLAELREYSKQSNQAISKVLTEAVTSYLERSRVRPAVRAAIKETLEQNSELLSRLAQ